MSDTLINCLRRDLPPELLDAFADKLDQLEQGKYEDLLRLPVCHSILEHLGLGDRDSAGLYQWSRRIPVALEAFDRPPAWKTEHCQYLLLTIAIAALQLFLQANVTGPPLTTGPFELIDVRRLAQNKDDRLSIHFQLLNSLSVDGEAAYRLTHHVELFCLAKAILNELEKQRFETITWLRLRMNFVHQRLLSEVSPTLQKAIYEDIDALEDVYANQNADKDVAAAFLLEIAAIHSYYGLEKEARACLDRAASRRQFQFALTGVLGKRTKYQEKETSQLVVLAQSHTEISNGHSPKQHEVLPETTTSNGLASEQPLELDLNDDTLLERIQFTEKSASTASIVGTSDLPDDLATLDPSNQPLLHPVDSAILLSLASSITNTRPDEGLTREETLPYAQRVLEGGSSNWQVYTQALLVRSRIEGYKSRTTERGLLQLQALVDQVIADTTETPKTTNGTEHDVELAATPDIQLNGTSAESQAGSSTFLPRSQASESAPASSRLAYLPLLNSPFRWTLEAELAARWTSLGGLRTALEIYERLEMWAEAALCWAATEREDKAVKIIRRLLYEPKDAGDEEFGGELKQPPPADAPRLHCILGDMSTDMEMKTVHYDLAWSVSSQRYSRAQRSLGRMHYSRKDFKAAAAAYNRSLKANALNGQTWFAMGCALLELEEWETATEAFSRVVKLDETDAEGWSNLAAGLLRTYERGYKDDGSATRMEADDEDGEDSVKKVANPQQPLHTALTALKRAAQLKHDSSIIWQNVLTVAMTISPPAYLDALVAQRRIIELRGKTDGESCIDVNVLEMVGREVMSLPYHVAASSVTNGANGTTNANSVDQVNPALSRGIPRMFLTLLTEQVIPLITTSARLWRLVSHIRLWQGRSSEALQALESGWRAVLAGPIETSKAAGQTSSSRSLSVPTRGGITTSSSSATSTFEDGNEEHWKDVVEETLELVDGYESLGGRTDAEGEAVLKDWKFKARSAIRGVMGKGRELWGESEGYERLKGRLEELRA